MIVLSTKNKLTVYCINNFSPTQLQFQYKSTSRLFFSCIIFQNESNILTMIRIQLIFLGLLSVFICPSMGAIVLSTFQQEALVQHNYYRQQLHCTTGMTLNSSISTIAQNYAEFLAANSLFNHSGVSGLGENLWMLSSSGVISSLNGKTKIRI